MRHAVVPANAGATIRTASILLTLALAACASAPRPPEIDPKLAETLHESVIRAAVAHPGATVCRPLQVGIAIRDWLRGEVVDVRDDVVGVRVVDAGHFPHYLEKTPVVAGTELRAAATTWIPCE